MSGSKISASQPDRYHRTCRQIQLLSKSSSISHNMLYVIGLGLSDEKDITVKGLEVCKISHGR